MTDSLKRLSKESRRYRMKRSAQRYFSLLTLRMTPGLVILVTCAFLGRLLWPPLILSLLLAPLWILGVAVHLLRNSSLWSIPQWRADALAESDPQEAKKMYEAIVDLYATKPWATDAVRHAREALGRLKQ